MTGWWRGLLSDYMKLMVMAGTSDARRIIKKLSGSFSILATATTSHGAELARSSGADKVLQGRFNSQKLADIINEYYIEILIDATHPFASEATKNAIMAADAAMIKYMRFERKPLDIPENDLIHRVHSFEEAALKTLKITDGRVFHLAGVMTLHHLTERIDPDRIVARVLPSIYSLKKCLELGLPASNIIAMEGIFSKEFNQALMEEYDVSLVVTKESGDAGGTPSKIEAALELGIPVIMVMRPEVEELAGKNVFNDVDAIYREIVDLNK